MVAKIGTKQEKRVYGPTSFQYSQESPFFLMAVVILGACFSLAQATLVVSMTVMLSDFENCY